jgi:hypothetical protein
VHGAPFPDPVPGVEEPDEFVVVDHFTLSDDGPDDRVEAWTIAATCQNADTHACKG